MRQEITLRVKTIQASTSEEFDRKFNKAVKQLEDVELKWDTAPMCVHLLYKETVQIPETLAEEFGLRGEHYFCKDNRGNTYLGPIDNPETFGKGESLRREDRYPDFAAIAQGFGWGSRSIIKKEDLHDALQEMLDYDGPYILDVAIPYRENVLPLIPAGGTFEDTIVD